MSRSAQTVRPTKCIVVLPDPRPFIFTRVRCTVCGWKGTRSNAQRHLQSVRHREAP